MANAISTTRIWIRQTSQWIQMLNALKANSVVTTWYAAKGTTLTLIETDLEEKLVSTERNQRSFLESR